jgi:DUF2075 family protein
MAKYVFMLISLFNSNAGRIKKNSEKNNFRALLDTKAFDLIEHDQEKIQAVNYQASSMRQWVYVLSSIGQEHSNLSIQILSLLS